MPSRERDPQAVAHYEQAKTHKQLALMQQGAFVAAAEAFKGTIKNDI